MAVLRSYKCPRHGYFEGWEPKCEHGCEDVAVVILKAPSMRDSGRTSRTRAADNAQKSLAKDFKMTNIKSTKEGEFQEGYFTRNNSQPAGPSPRDAVMWGNGGRFDMSSVLGGGAVQSVAGEQVGFNPKANNLTKGPTPSIIQKDHEGLKIE